MCSVTPKTPPLAPMSCPSSTTRLSRSNSSVSAEFSASIIVICMLALAIYIAQEIGALLFQTRGKGCRCVVKEATRCHGRHGLGDLYCFVDFFLNLLDDLPHTILVKQVAPGEELLETHNRFFCAPGFYLGGVAVARGVIGGGMRSDTIGECFYECWSLSITRSLDRFLHDIVDRQDIVTIHQLGWHSEACSTHGKCRHSALLIAGNADGPAIVLNDQYDGSLKDSREI